MHILLRKLMIKKGNNFGWPLDLKCVKPPVGGHHCV